MRTISPDYYQTPSKNEIKTIATEVGINQYSPTLVQDMANIIAGGYYVASSVMREDIEKNIQLPKPDHNGDYKKKNKSYTRDYGVAKESYVQAELKYHENIISFLKEVNLENLPGDSSLEKALNCIKILSKKLTGEKETDSNGDNIIPLFAYEKDSKGAAAKLNESIELVKKLDKEDKELLDLDEKEEENIAKLMKDDLKKILLQTSSTINELSKLKTKPTNKLKKSFEGDVKVPRPIQDFGEFKKLSKKELVNNRKALNMRIINKEAQVLETYEREFRMPTITILCDDSGSMNSSHKEKKALGIIYNVLKRVMKKECNLHFSFFEQQCEKFFYLDKDTDVKEFFSDVILKHGFNNGQTDVRNAIAQAIAEVDIKGSDNHLIIINDGEDNCSSLSLQDLKGARLHAFILDSSNEDIRRVCAASGGVYKEEI